MTSFKSLTVSSLLLAFVANVFTENNILVSQPPDATVALGEKIIFTARLPPSNTEWLYKWFLNDEMLSDVPTSTLELIATKSLQNAQIFVVIREGKTNRYIATSNTVFLRIKDYSADEFTLPASVSAFSGESVTLYIPEQQAPRIIQWFIDGFPLPGQNFPQLRLKVTSELDNSELSVVVTTDTGLIRRTCLLHVYLAKWIIAVLVIGGVVLLALVFVILKKHGYIFNSTTNKNLEAGFTPLAQQKTNVIQQEPVSTELELN